VAWVIAIGGIILLIVLHEAGHFLAAKAVGMRVERFSLFFPPTIASFRIGETEYALGSIPAGGYVKITGMSPEELETVDPEHHDRAYCNQAPWKRIVVILAGPVTNLLIAFVIFAAVFWSGSLTGDTVINNIAPAVVTLAPGTIDDGGISPPLVPALHAYDEIVKIDGRAASNRSVNAAVKRDVCAGVPVTNCRAAKPLAFTILRHGKLRNIAVYPRYGGNAGMLVGISLAGKTVAVVRKHFPAAGIVHVGDALISVDGQPGTQTSLLAADHADRCAGKPRVGCRGAKPIDLTVRRAGRVIHLAVDPRYVAPAGAMSLGVYLVRPLPFGAVAAFGASAATMWQLTGSTLAHYVKAVVNSQARAQLHSIVGITQVTAQAVSDGPALGFDILAYVSLILGVVNLFPFLPLDGGHVAWSLAEWIGRRRISTSVMWRVSTPGLIILAFLVFSGVSNDFSRLVG
jgi:RIP metalloprotease RseP